MKTNQPPKLYTAYTESEKQSTTKTVHSIPRVKTSQPPKLYTILSVKTNQPPEELKRAVSGKGSCTCTGQCYYLQQSQMMYAGTEGGRGCTMPHRTLPLASSFYYSLTDLYGQVAAIFNLAQCRLPGPGVYVRRSCSSFRLQWIFTVNQWASFQLRLLVSDFSLMSVQPGLVVYGLPACSYTDVLSGRN